MAGPWHVRVEGSKGDLTRLSQSLPDGLTIEERTIPTDGGWWLFDPTAPLDKDDAREHYARVVKILNGLARVEFGLSYEGARFADQMRDPTTTAVFVGGPLTVYGAAHLGLRDGSPPPPPKLPKRLHILRQDATLADAITLLSDTTSFVDLYKVYEAIRKAVGGQAAVNKLFGGKKARDRFTRSANHPHRHYEPPDEPLESPMRYHEAFQAIQRALTTALDARGATDGARRAPENGRDQDPAGSYETRS